MGASHMSTTMDIVQLCTAFISREVFHVVNPTIPYISQFLQQDLGSNILLRDLSLEESDMKKEVLNRLCVGESGGEMVIFHKKQCQKSSWRHPAPGIGQVSCETASEMVAGGFNCSRLWAFGHCLWLHTSISDLLVLCELLNMVEYIAHLHLLAKLDSVVCN